MGWLDGWMDVSKMDKIVVLLGFFQAKQPKIMANYGPQFLNWKKTLKPGGGWCFFAAFRSGDFSLESVQPPSCTAVSAVSTPRNLCKNPTSFWRIFATFFSGLLGWFLIAMVWGFHQNPVFFGWKVGNPMNAFIIHCEPCVLAGPKLWYCWWFRNPAPVKV